MRVWRRRRRGVDRVEETLRLPTPGVGVGGVLALRETGCMGIRAAFSRPCSSGGWRLGTAAPRASAHAGLPLGSPSGGGRVLPMKEVGLMTRDESCSSRQQGQFVQRRET